MEIAAYIRVSTEEQKDKGYSLQNQNQQISRDCKQKGFNLLPEYEDECSGKNFNRPGFNRFLSDVKSKKIKPDRLVVTKIDRFSRDVFDTIFMVKTLNHLGIKVFSLAEGEINFTNAHTFFPNLIQSGAAQYDNLLRADNTVRGMRQAQKEGRWMSTAPFGYKSDKINKVIVVDEVNGEIVKKAFRIYSEGIYSAEEIRKKLSKEGLKLSKQAFLNMLRNPAYIGKIKIKQFKEEPEEIVQGIHDPLITEDEFYRVQRVLSGCRNTSSKGISRKDELPLRGFLYCSKCAKKLTGSASTSQNKAKHHYYHCQNGCNERFRADYANSRFISYLESFEVSEPVKVLYKHLLEDVFDRDDKSRLVQKAKVEKELETLNYRIESITDKFADGNIDKEVFQSTIKRYDSLKEELLFKHKSLIPEMASFKKHISFGFSLVENLSQYYNLGDLAIKQRLVSSIFKEKLIFDRKNYRTTELNGLLALISNSNRGLRIKDKKKASISADLSSMAPPAGLEPATL